MGYIVSKCLATLFSEPNTQSEVIDELLYGWAVSVIGETTNFYQVKTFYNYRGYVEKTSITVNQIEHIEQNVIVSHFADVLNKPEIKSVRLLTLQKGALVSVLKKSEHYTQILMPHKKIGYIKNEQIGKYVKPVDFVKEENQIREAIVNHASSYLGTPYRWGGKTAMGIDCSGLSFMAYFMTGIPIYRDAILKEGFPIQEIKKEALKKGDLIFFKGHVGIYIENDDFLHASDRYGDVRLDKLTNELPWKLVNYGSLFNEG